MAFLKISQVSQQNICAEVSFLIKFQASDLVFSHTFYNIFKNTCVFIVEAVGTKELNVI